MTNGQKDKGDAFTWTADADITTKLGWIKKVKLGVRYDDRGAEENSYLGSDLHCNDAPDAKARRQRISRASWALREPL